MSAPGIQDFHVLLGSLLSPHAYEYLLRGLGCGVSAKPMRLVPPHITNLYLQCADVARASSDLLSLILTKCEEHLSMAEYDAMNSCRALSAILHSLAFRLLFADHNASGSPSPPRSTPLVKPNIPLPPPSPPLIPAGETVPLSVIDTGPVDAVATGWESPPASPTGASSPQWSSEGGVGDTLRPNSWQDEGLNSGWAENPSGGTGGASQQPPPPPPPVNPHPHEEDENIADSAYHSNDQAEGFRLPDKTLMAMRDFTHLVTSGPLQDLICSFIIPQVRAIRQYRKGRRGRNNNASNSPTSDEPPASGDMILVPSSSQSPKNGDTSPVEGDTPRRMFTDEVSHVDFVPAKSIDTTTSATWEKMAEEVWGPAGGPSSSSPPETLPESTSGSTVPSANEALSPEKSTATTREDAVEIKLERVDLPQGNKPRVGGLCLSFVTLVHSILQLDTAVSYSRPPSAFRQSLYATLSTLSSADS